jgi:HEAT repeat protein
VIEVLLEVLSTPSEAVQRAVSACLPALMPSLAEDQAYMETLISQLLTGLKTGATYGDRRGAAFGLSGVVKGLGISSLKNYGVLDALKAAVEDKRDARPREGALLAFECLCEKLGRLFEPYIIHILPLLLQCFGDPSPQVRAAASDAARLIMGQLSASGVKLVLPALLKGLEDPAWRTKQGSIQLLGSMAYCAPRQLSTCLPKIVPTLSTVLSDPHPKVQAAAREALTEVGSVIRSPEMAALVPVLLSAISDPNTATRECLDALLDTTFINTIDAASLALLVPVVHRGLRDRSGDTKKRAARIVGNMCSLTQDPKVRGGRGGRGERWKLNRH